MSTAPLSPLPRYQGMDLEMRAWSERFCSALEIWSRSLSAPAGGSWVVNGIASQREVDPSTLTTLDDVIDALGTLVHDLSKGAPLAVT